MESIQSYFFVATGNIFYLIITTLIYLYYIAFN
jgi:hypothetical protein